jgi:D-alanine-D-alanine ligase
MKHIAVLKGGWSAEREVSLNSGAACAKALRELGYRVTEIDMQPNIAQVLAEVKPDVVFNALHGRIGEDGSVQGLLDIMQIPYTHSGVLASSVAMDKPMAKLIFTAAGLKCAEGKVVSREDMLKGDPIARPYVVKPSNEGSSVGVKLVFENDNFFFTAQNWPYGDTVLVEQYIAGREITAAVLGDRALGVTEITTRSGFYDYDNKYTDGGSIHICPAQLTEAEYKSVMEMALIAHRALGCRGLSRSDFRYDGKDFYILETNTQPGMTALSLSPEIAAHAGISFNQLVQTLVDAATHG